jgi:hypothetical protein
VLFLKLRPHLSGGAGSVNMGRESDMRVSFVAPLAFALGFAALASADTTPPARPYAGMETRGIKALSEAQIADLEAGRGMGLALAAELNGYPGPAHVLELADALHLTAEQRARTEILFAEMKAEAIARGAAVLRGETALDRAFAEHSVSPAALRAQLIELGTAQGELRNTHLKYHLAMVDVMARDQIAAYRRLRGYSETPLSATGDHRGHRH